MRKACRKVAVQRQIRCLISDFSTVFSLADNALQAIALIAFSFKLPHLECNRGELNMRLPKNIVRTALPLALIALTATLAAGCAKKQRPDEITPSTDMGGSAAVGDSDSGKALGLVTSAFPTTPLHWMAPRKKA